MENENLNDDDENDNKWVDVSIICKDARDAAIIMGELTRCLGATDNLFTLREAHNEQNN